MRRRSATGAGSRSPAIWWEIHKALPVKASELHDDVKKVADPQDRGRPYLASYLEKLAGTRMAGIVLTRQASAAKWAVATYQLSRTDDTGDHDGHRGHGPHGPADAPDAPYADQHHKNGSTVTAASFDSSGATPIDIEEGRL